MEDFFCSLSVVLGFLTQSLMLARQAHYHLSLSATPPTLLAIVVFQTGSHVDAGVT
jgi:hypothetical protein